MRIELLHIADCPNWAETGRRLRLALAATGHDEVPIDYRLLETPEEAAAVPFAGSPTITVDGTDLFPVAARIDDLACRVYSTPAGLAGLPTVEQLTDALSGVTTS